MAYDLKQSDYIQTFSGTMFYFNDPQPEQVRIDDIAHALSNQCRFMGHCGQFYSVAEHCVHCSDRAPRELKLTALMHDAAEAYLHDLPRPIKYAMPEYIVTECRIERVLAAKYRYEYPYPPLIKEIDNRLMHTEAKAFFSGQENRWWESFDPPYDDLVLGYWTPRRAKAEFMNTFWSCYNGKSGRSGS